MFFSCFLVIFILSLNLISCNDIKRNNSMDASIPTGKMKESVNFDEFINSMTLNEKIGQLFVVAFEGKELNSNIKELIEKYKVGGVILFDGNVSDIKQTVSLINNLKSVNSNNKHPLFVSVDEEGGRVTRIPVEFKRMPSSADIGRTGKVEIAENAGNIIGESLRILGFNVDFAPVLDIYSNPQNTIIRGRSFGNDVNIVTKMGVAEVKALKENSIIAVPKHFPGHGDTSIDSHIGLPIVHKSLSELKNFEFKPFEEAINNRADAIMVGHIVLSEIDKNNPASLSKDVIEILKKDLKFEGLVVSDDMTMGAITKNYNLEDSVLKSINAGIDLVLVCNGFENQVKSINRVKEALSTGELTEERLNESIYKILKLKYKYGLKDNILSNNIDISKINLRISNLINSLSVKRERAILKVASFSL
ncbi:beta-N-acetylhexosaminidase [Clostridium massiliamazoniense]|uniref:beta-N-acetylhexosaminidase n=1 Tax=Clostridium massiliamazoniense TaxID=1347366 RepID=UPI0006D85CA6|nr:beta-N-acetylhexosaminidase [Clostridium massiliamazoniense]